MKQINNGFAECYYLLENGLVYNQLTNKVVKPKSKHLYNLKDTNGHYKQISQKTLYKIVYNKIFCMDEIQNLENEQWKEIHDTDSFYYVSNKGRIKSYKSYKAIVLQPYTNQSGYDRVDIMQYGKRRSVLVHRLVAEAFLPLPDRLDMQLHHKDFQKHNNSSENLEWLSIADHAKKHSDYSILKGQNLQND